MAKITAYFARNGKIAYKREGSSGGSSGGS